MKITEYDWEIEDGRCGYQIHIDDKRVFGVHDGEPEDNTIGRNFNDVLIIVNLMKKAYLAGKAGEEFEVEWLDRKPNE